MQNTKSKTFSFENASGHVATITLSTDRGYISVTGCIYDRTDRIPGESSVVNSAGVRRWMGECGQCQESIFADFPVPADHPARLVNPYHMADVNGQPMHYVDNALYHAGKCRVYGGDAYGYYPANLESFRRVAIWPDATVADMQSVSVEMLRARLDDIKTQVLAAVALIESLPA